ncbi:MAG: hypothetical protein U5K38_13235 [Woeseiaceae bacterium]|nr:hypothetical protein [Woeseiaceae bacterium]
MPPADWSIEQQLEYFDWAEKVIAGCRGVNAAMESCFDQRLIESRAHANANANGQ